MTYIKTIFSERCCFVGKDDTMSESDIHTVVEMHHGNMLRKSIGFSFVYVSEDHIEKMDRLVEGLRDAFPEISFPDPIHVENVDQAKIDQAFLFIEGSESSFGSNLIIDLI
ncbi:MAG: hypothetical protein KAR24_01030 [Candidatus Pacebacteria bacterium]|nr:hypothetical protein [Candidatus Paceibacterota bacterium]